MSEDVTEVVTETATKLNFDELVNDPQFKSYLDNHTKAANEALERKLREALGEKKDLKTRLSKYETTKAEAEGNVEELKKHFQSEISTREEKLNAMQTRMAEKEVKAQMANVLAEHKGNAALLEPILRDRVRSTVDEDGNVQITVLGENGQMKYRQNGDPATIEDLVKELKQKTTFAVAFASSGSTGVGSKQTSATNTTTQINPFDKKSAHFNLTEASKLYIRDPALARQLAAQVGIVLKD